MITAYVVGANSVYFVAARDESGRPKPRISGCSSSHWRRRLKPDARRSTTLKLSIFLLATESHRPQMWLDAVSFLERAICCRSYYAQSCSGIILLTVRNHWCEQPTYKIAENVAYIDNPKIINLLVLEYSMVYTCDFLHLFFSFLSLLFSPLINISIFVQILHRRR